MEKHLTKLTCFAPWEFWNFADGEEGQEPRSVTIQRQVVEMGVEDGEDFHRYRRSVVMSVVILRLQPAGLFWVLV
jgi:hypothetical protein